MKWVSSRSPATATAQSASWNCTAWKVAIGLPNWMRPLTCSTVSSTARSHVPRTDAAVSVTWNSTSGSVPAASVRAARRPSDLQVDDERAEPGAERRGGRVGERGGTEERRDHPLVEQVAVVDPGQAVGHGGEGPPVAVGEQHRRDGVGERHATGGLAQRRGGRQRVAVGPRVELVDAQGSERAGDVTAP